MMDLDGKTDEIRHSLAVDLRLPPKPKGVDCK